ncbi:MAG: creatininase family protein [Planctomycetota bacterium]
MVERSREVRYQLLRPSEIRARRDACPIVYIPIGTLEWHGPHLPVGADTLQAEGLAVRCAERGGGLVFPPLYYGESRSESLVDANHEDAGRVAETLGLSAEHFGVDRQPFSPMEQALHYERLLVHILAEAMSLGFRVGILVAGHYPLIDHARAAVLRFNKWRPARYGGMLAWACLDYKFLEDTYAGAGDHAAGWETAHLLHLTPEAVDLDSLPPKGTPVLAVSGALDPRDATAAFGAETLDAAAEIIVREARHRLDHREAYHGHGDSLAEGLWRRES